MNNQKRYKVTLNWYGEIRVFWTGAVSESQARAFVVKKFSQEMNREPFSMLAYFNGKRDNMQIKEA